MQVDEKNPPTTSEYKGENTIFVLLDVNEPLIRTPKNILIINRPAGLSAGLIPYQSRIVVRPI